MKLPTKYTVFPLNYVSYLFNPLILGTFALITESIFCEIPLKAQIIPDNTLGNENSQVIPNQIIKGIPSELIEGGAIRGGNLFHSFSEFNIQEGLGAYFANPQGIINILGRVTGNNLSEIMGTLGVLGNANLFFVNPNGIIFGENAQLDIRGSFFATTSDGFVFGNGEEFSATNPSAPPLLIDNTSGIDFSGPGRGDITVSGDLGVQPFMSATIHGGMVTLNGSISAPGGNVAVLGETVALVEEATVDVSHGTRGGTVLIGGGFSEVRSNQSLLGEGNIPTAQSTFIGPNVVINADGIGTGDGGEVAVWSDKNTDFQGTITARGGSLGGNGGFIETSARDNLSVTGTVNASAINGDAGTWLIDPTNITITKDGDGEIGSNMVAASKIEEALNGDPNDDQNNGMNVVIDTSNVTQPPDVPTDEEGNITQKERAFIKWTSGTSLTLKADNNITLNDEINSFSDSGNGGDITLTAGGNITLNDEINSSSAAGNAGNITFKAQNLILNEGVQVLAATSSTGTGGNITIENTNNLTLNNGATISNRTSGKGNAGNIEINSPQIIITANSRIDTRTNGMGDGGDIIINASDFIQLTGQGSEQFEQALLEAFQARLEGIDNPNLSEIFSISTATTGKGVAGNITITTPQLIMDNGAIVISTSFSDQNAGNITINSSNLEIHGSGLVSGVSGNQGKAGDITINTATAKLTEGGKIIATTFSAEDGGNVMINATEAVELISVPDPLFLPTTIIASSVFGTGNAGDVTIVTPNLTLSEGAQISTTSGSDVPNITVGGKSGNIEIEAQTFTLNGTASSGRFETRLSSETITNADAGNIKVTAETININNNASISVRTFGQGNAGDIKINADQLIQLTGQGSQQFEQGIIDLVQARLQGGINNLDVQEEIFFTISTATTGKGVAGNITITTPQLILDNGAVVVSSSFSEQDAGNITINSSNLEINGSGLVSAASGNQGQAGDIIVNSATAKLTEGSKIIATTFSTEDGGDVMINATEAVELISVPDPLFLPTAIITSSAFGTGKAGDVTILTPNLTLTEGAQISTTSGGVIGDEIITLGGKGGNIEVEAQTFTLNGTASSRRLETVVSSETFTNADAGNIKVTAETININNNAAISVSTFGQGNAGSVSTRANQNVSLDNGRIESAVTETATGDAGTVEVIAPTIDLNNNSIISSSTAGDGDAGDVIIDASEQLLLNNNSLITSEVLPTAGSDAGNLDIVTATLAILNGSGLSTSNQAEGTGGNIDISVFGNLTLDNLAFISSETQGGAGNIVINAENVFLTNQSNISTNATGEAAGGNITINTGILLGLGNSDITANSENSAGGQIIINAGSVLGLQVRENLTENSDITATGTLRGNIILNIDETEEGRGQIQLPQNIIDPNTLLSQNVCQRGTNSEFIIFGKGGLAITPSDFLIPTVIELDWVEPVNNPEIEGIQPNSSYRIDPDSDSLQPLQFSSC